MSELVAETPPAETPAAELAEAPAPAPAEAEPVKATPKRRSSSAAALLGATADEVKRLSAGFGIVGENSGELMPNIVRVCRGLSRLLV